MIQKLQKLIDVVHSYCNMQVESKSAAMVFAEGRRGKAVGRA